jgi:predicted Zn-dependent protease
MSQGATYPVGNSNPPRTYEGGAFHPAFPNGRGVGTVQVGPLAVYFTGKAGQLELPLAGLSITLGGASDRIIFFKHPSLPDTTLHTADHAILKEAVFQERPELLAQVGKVQGRKRSNLAVLLVALALFGTVLAGIFAALEPMVIMVADSIPPEAEITFGDNTFKAYTAKYQFVQDAELEAGLAALTKPLVEGMKDEPFKFRFHIVDDDTPNAFAVPGGQIVIHSGLILWADSAEELAGAVAHEMAHVKLRHSVKLMVKSLGIWVVFNMFLGDVQDRVGTLTKNAQKLLNMQYSREMEREADSIGWDLMLAVNRDPRGVISFHEKMQRLEDNVGMESSPYTESHPPTSERIRALREKAQTLPKDQQYQGFDLNFAEFQNTLRSKLKQADKPKPGTKQ